MAPLALWRAGRGGAHCEPAGARPRPQRSKLEDVGLRGSVLDLRLLGFLEDLGGLLPTDAPIDAILLYPVVFLSKLGDGLSVLDDQLAQLDQVLVLHCPNLLRELFAAKGAVYDLVNVEELNHFFFASQEVLREVYGIDVLAQLFIILGLDAGNAIL